MRREQLTRKERRAQRRAFGTPQTGAMLPARALPRSPTAQHGRPRHWPVLAARPTLETDEKHPKVTWLNRRHGDAPVLPGLVIVQNRLFSIAIIEGPSRRDDETLVGVYFV